MYTIDTPSVSLKDDVLRNGLIAIKDVVLRRNQRFGLFFALPLQLAASFVLIASLRLLRSVNSAARLVSRPRSLS